MNLNCKKIWIPMKMNTYGRILKHSKQGKTSLHPPTNGKQKSPVPVKAKQKQMMQQKLQLKVMMEKFLMITMTDGKHRCGNHNH